MPVCNTCNGTEFECSDGKFFCVECDTQSQNFVDEQTTELLDNASFTTKRLTKRVSKNSTTDKGLPWRCVEGFQLIIKAHVKALIDLGFTPSLDNVMQQIWFKFVHKSGMAVIDRNEGVFKAEDITFRDFFLEQFKDDIFPSRAVSREVNIRVSRNAKKKSPGSTELESEQEWFSVDTEFEDVDDISDGDVSSKTHLKGSNKKSVRKRRHNWRGINVMINPKIIAFCYIALRWCSEPVTIGDLFHWAEEGRLPYFGSKECFLPHMKMSASDHQTFDQRKCLDYEKVFAMTLHLEKYLEMPTLPTVNAMELTSRYLYQLNLPLSLAAYGINLLEQFNENATTHSTVRLVIKSVELRTAAILVILLKLIFTLNDCDEWRIDYDCPCPTEHQNQEACYNFTWKNWVRQHLLYQREKLQNEYILFDDRDLSEVGDVHVCMENYLSVVIKGTDIKSEQNRPMNMKERSNIRSFTFAHLAEKQGSADVKRKVSEELKHPKNLYELFGRCEGLFVDFTKVCPSRFSKSMRSHGTTYLRYKSRHLENDFHSSYHFLLKMISHLTHSTVSSLHECVWLIERSILVKQF